MRTRRLVGQCALVLLLLRAAPVLADDAESRYAEAWRHAHTAVG